MSSFGHASKDWCIVRSFRVELAGGSEIDPHHHAWHQLVYASYGALEVTTMSFPSLTECIISGT